ncbi:MAG: hypothetical protein Ct9H300mP28_25080 [Pseudomonadota bacterium]|nr:MAG: hypothetical protein Ct9H300mP28_25080 [Pseudomonadota bacterium]
MNGIRFITPADQISSHLQQKAVLNETEHPELNWQAEEQAVAQFRSSFDSQMEVSATSLKTNFLPVWV